MFRNVGIPPYNESAGKFINFFIPVISSGIELRRIR
jgi:hypothetical protein